MPGIHTHPRKPRRSTGALTRPPVEPPTAKDQPQFLTLRALLAEHAIAAHREERMQRVFARLQTLQDGNNNTQAAAGALKVTATEIEAAADPNNANQEARKFFTFNQTGNIMISTTATNTDEISTQVRTVFEEVMVFFAGMTKAITNTPRPGATTTASAYYTIYDLDALEKVIGGSGLFAEVSKEEIAYSSSSYGAEFSKQLITGLLGLATGTGALSFATGLIASMGNEAVKLSEERTSQSGRIAHIVFVCEYMLAIPLVSAIVISVDTSEVLEAIKIGPCASAEHTAVKMKLRKEVFLFVPPSLITTYAQDLNTVIDAGQYSLFVEFLSSLISGRAFVKGLLDSNSKFVDGTLTPGGVYTISGSNFGQAQNKGYVTYGYMYDPNSANYSPPNLLTILSWSDSAVTFSNWSSGSFQSLTVDSLFLYADDKTTLLGEVTPAPGINVPFTFLSATVTTCVNQTTSVKVTAENNDLVIGTAYVLNGTDFPSSQGALTLGHPAEGSTNFLSLTVSSWTESTITFTVPDGSTQFNKDKPIFVFSGTPATVDNQIGVSPGVFNVSV